jgi:hypothetical protein
MSINRLNRLSFLLTTDYWLLSSACIIHCSALVCQAEASSGSERKRVRAPDQEHAPALLMIVVYSLNL